MARQRRCAHLRVYVDILLSGLRRGRVGARGRRHHSHHHGQPAGQLQRRRHPGHRPTAGDGIGRSPSGPSTGGQQLQSVHRRTAAAVCAPADSCSLYTGGQLQSVHRQTAAVCTPADSCSLYTGVMCYETCTDLPYRA